MKFRIQIEQDKDGVFVATCPALPGCVSQGETRQQATSNIREAIEVYLMSLRKHDEPGGRIPASALHEEWMKDPEYRREYDALEDEFSLAAERLRRARD
jgi:predicted RNase H-like HicB family nuclease